MTTGTAPPRRPSRLWIAAIPVAVVAMLASNGYRVSDFWWSAGQHHEIASAAQGEWAEVSEQTSDAHGDTTRDYSVRLAGLGGADTAYEDRSGNDVTLAEGMVARTVRLDFRADPGEPLKNCQLTLIDGEGREYRVGAVFDELGPRVTNCVPEETPGPSLPVLTYERRGALPEGELPRPTEWSVAPAIAAPRDATFVELRIVFEDPDYVTLKLAR